MKQKIPLFRTYWNEEDIESVTKVIKRGSYWATGPEIQEFEERIAEYIGTKYALVFNSGTSALHATLLAYGFKEGDEIIVPSFTFIATANAPLFVGAKPVFAEIEEKTFGFDSEDVKEKITKRTKAIIPVHYGGCPCLDIKELKEIAADNNLILIEDAAESLGAKIGKDMVGTFGDIAMFSFCQNKVVATGEGGAITTDSKKIYEKLKLIRSHGRLETQDYFSSNEFGDYVTLGYNFRMPTMLAALGITQIKKIDNIIKMRRERANYMTKKMSRIKKISLPIPPSNYFHVYQMYTIKLNDTKETRDKLMKYLGDNGIISKVYFKPVHLTHFYIKKFGFKKGDMPVTENISNQVLTFHPYPLLKNGEIDYITKKIDEFFSWGV